MKFLMDRVRRHSRNWDLYFTSNNIFIICFTLLSIIYARIIFITPTLFELGDEYEYLWNAAFLAGKNWLDIYLEYYGYGYSVFLIPAVIFGESGTDIIRAAYILNILFIVSTYCVFNSILCVISCSKKNIYPIISFIACLSPYFFSNVAKVFCEMCLSFFYSLDVLFIALALKRRKGIYYVISSVTTAYLYAIHTRSIGIILVYFGLLYMDFILKGRGLRKVIFSIGIVIISLLVLYGIKNNIINFKVSLMVEETHFNNVIDATFIFERISWLVSGILNYIGAFLAKMFYWLFATYGLIFLLIEYLKVGSKEKNSNVEEREVIFFALSVGVVSIILCNLNGTGGNAYYVIYGRYYEFSVPLLVCMGLYILFEGRIMINTKKILFQVLCMTAICKGVMSWIYSFMAEYMVEIDTNRLSYLSLIIKWTPDILEVLFVALVIVIMLLFGYMEVLKKKIHRVVCIMALILLSLFGGKTCIDSVEHIHEHALKDSYIANYLLSNCVKNVNKIYFLDDKSYMYDNFFSRIYLLIKPLEFDVIENSTKENLSEIETEDYLITYSGSNIITEEMREYHKILEGTSVTLYQKQ